MRMLKLPCVPYDLNGMERWINELASEGWRIKSFVLGTWAVLEPGEAREYRIYTTSELSEFGGYKRQIPGTGFTISEGRPVEHDEKSLRRAAHQGAFSLFNIFNLIIGVAFNLREVQLIASALTTPAEWPGFSAFVFIVCACLLVEAAGALITLGYSRTLDFDRGALLACSAAKIADALLFVTLIAEIIFILSGIQRVPGM